MELLEGTVQSYDWGSSTIIPELLGTEPDDRPQAELWLGAHERGPARVTDGRTLGQVIAADPTAALGADGGDGLSFLPKVLAADRPLSIQLHPDRAQAEAGFAREDAAGIAIDAPERTFRDRNHKPELLCALTEFHALCGFRPPETVLAVIGDDAGVLDGLREALAGSGTDAERLRAALSWLLALDDGQASAVLGGLAGVDDPVVARLVADHPADVGAAVAVLLRPVRLEPGDAMFLAAGNLHAYLHGAGIEIMANSDNVVRGGLTTKHIDRATLLDLVDTRPLDDPVQHAEGAVHRYDVPVPDFGLLRLDGGAATVEGPAVAIVTRGVVDVAGTRLARGQAAWIPAADGPVAVDAEAGQVHMATTGR